MFLKNHIYFCPADDLPIFFVFRLLEHLRTADGLHGFPINGTYNSVGQKHIIFNKDQKWKCSWHNTALGEIYSNYLHIFQVFIHYWQLTGVIYKYDCCIVLFKHKSLLLRLPHELQTRGHTHPLFTVHFSSTHCTQTSSWLSDWSSRPQVTV